MKKILESAKNLSFVVFYGSQLGQAESIANTLAQQASDYEFKVEAFPLNEIRDATELTKLECPIVIVSSTTGDGEPPENADRFWRKIRKKALKSGALAGVQYTILGLGDTNYNQFCNCGKEIHKRLQDLGAVTFHPPGWADDAIGLELVVDDWIDELWLALEKLIRPDCIGQMANKNKDDNGLTLPVCPPASLKLEFQEDLKTFPVDLEDPLQPYPLIEGLPTKTLISKARCLTKPGALKVALEITLKFQSRKFDFEPGDAISVVCPNPTEEVNNLLARLGVSDISDKPIILTPKENAKGKIPAFIPPGCSIRQLFTNYCDIRSPPKKNFLRLLAEYTTEESEKNKLLELSSRQGATLFENTVRFPTLSLLDILLTYSSCLPSPEVLIEHLPRLIPRAYSISSSPLRCKDSFTVAFNIITFSEEDGRKYKRTGVCSGWLYELCKDILEKDDSNSVGLDEYLQSKFQNMTLEHLERRSGTEIIVYKRKNHNFRLPQELTAPIIMVGPGTGVAPFVGFSDHRDQQKKGGAVIGETFLYFGCRQKELDFLYQEELTTLMEEKTLSQLYVSFSRDQDQGAIKYVQDNLEKNKEEVVATMLEHQGYFYVCGDAKNMAKNVKDSFIQCIQSVKGLSEPEAKQLVAELVSSKLYLQDVWS